MMRSVRDDRLSRALSLIEEFQVAVDALAREDYSTTLSYEQEVKEEFAAAKKALTDYVTELTRNDSGQY